VVDRAVLLQILDRARWAPSGDNTQPWRFEVRGADGVVVHASDTSDHVVYDLDGHCSQMSVGAMIETAAIAATAHGLSMVCHRDVEMPVARPRFHLQFRAVPGLARDSLIDFILLRSVQRGPRPTTPLLPEQQEALACAVGPGYQLHWFDTLADRTAMARLLFRSAKIRLTIPEALEAHREVIEGDARFSSGRVPSRALMRFRLQRWPRPQFLNRFLAGTWLARLEKDCLPALRCAAHVAILAEQPPGTIDDYMAAGRAAQRFWLTATSLGLNHQPEIAPLVFSRYVREGRTFSVQPSAWSDAWKVDQSLDRLLPGQAHHRAVWLGRIGGGPRATARSERLSLAELIISDATHA
jgi:hypothetical protein